MKSVLRKADEHSLAPGEIVIAAPAERELALLLDAFAAAVLDAWDKRAPNIVADHAFRLAQSFARFYAACPIIGAPDEASRSGRLGLTRLALEQLGAALGLLGIALAERM
jgi:arginyl-tRNA synthetase